jgi:hypothetical protein
MVRAISPTIKAEKSPSCGSISATGASVTVMPERISFLNAPRFF